MNPERPSQSQEEDGAFTGNGCPWKMSPWAVKSPKAITRRIKLTEREPTLRPALVKLKLLRVQQRAVPSAATSPG
jgi:hypothetical protein